MSTCPHISQRSTTTDPHRRVNTPSTMMAMNCATAVTAVSTVASGCPQCSDATTAAGWRSSSDWCQMTDATVWVMSAHPICSPHHTRRCTFTTWRCLFIRHTPGDVLAQRVNCRTYYNRRVHQPCDSVTKQCY